MIYYGTRLSENISRREPEGYLLCLNVPVARTGTQEYMPEELGLPPSEAAHTGPVSVLRPESEVFSPETVASFEGMPVTDGHPPDGVTVDNIRAFQKGHAHSVRRGAGSESDLLLADLIITDPCLIDRILAGKREISCGYSYDLCEENGQYVQRRIRGNHVAVVDAGRAGHRVSIKDQQPERRKPHMKKSLLKKLTCMARDGDPEAIEALAEAVEEIMENPPADAAAAVVVTAGTEPEPGAPAEEETSAAADEDTLSAILERLDRLIALLSPAGDDVPEELAEAIEESVEAAETTEASGTTAEEVASVMEEIIGPAVSTVLEPEEEEDGDCPAVRESGDALGAALRAIRPALKRMPRSERKRVCAGIAANLKNTGMDSLAYAALADAGARRPAVSDPAELGRRIMASRNPHYK